MNKLIYRILFVLLLLVVLPLLILISRQFSNLSENEEIVQEAYEKQLETVLFSINLNTENIINSWINRIDLPFDYRHQLMQDIVNGVFEDNKSLLQISFFPIKQSENNYSYVQQGIEEIDFNLPDTATITKLIDFHKRGYPRIESEKLNNVIMLYFISKSNNQSNLCFLFIDPQLFFNQQIKSSIQQIAQERFSINIIDQQLKKSILRTDTVSTDNYKAITSNFWYLPGFSMEISLNAKTIAQLVKERSKRDIYLLIGLLVFVVLGSVFIIFSVIREIQLAELKSEFVSNVSHEIRTPLALISMYSETLLLNRVVSEVKTKEYLNVINLETNRLSSMVNRILTFSKMEKNKRVYKFEIININDKIREIIDNFQPYFKAQLVNCTLHLDNDCDEIKCDVEAFTEAIINIVENAVKYGRDSNKTIEIKTKQTEKFLQISIVDNGIGIETKHLKYIFDKFYRVTQGDLAHLAKGTGLGLNIVKKIMKKHNGQITVISEINKGSCFTLHFPMNL